MKTSIKVKIPVKFNNIYCDLKCPQLKIEKWGVGSKYSCRVFSGEMTYTFMLKEPDKPKSHRRCIFERMKVQRNENGYAIIMIDFPIDYFEDDNCCNILCPQYRDIMECNIFGSLPEIPGGIYKLQSDLFSHEKCIKLRGKYENQ